MRILLVEDEQKTGDYLKQGLSEAGYITDWVTDVNRTGFVGDSIF